MSKIGDVALIRLKERPDVLTHRADPTSNGMTPINIPDMSTFRQFAGKYFIIDRSWPAIHIAIYTYTYIYIEIYFRKVLYCKWLGKTGVWSINQARHIE